MAEPSSADQVLALRRTGEPLIEVSGHHGYRLEAHELPDERASRRARAVVRDVLLRAGVDGGHVDDAELAVGELVANAVSYAAGPYEIRFVIDGERPVWCEIVDSDGDLVEIPEILRRLHLSRAPEYASGEVPQKRGRGLAIVHHLSGGRCKAYPTLVSVTGRPGKAVAFALPGARSQ